MDIFSYVLLQYKKYNTVQHKIISEFSNLTYFGLCFGPPEYDPHRLGWTKIAAASALHILDVRGLVQFPGFGTSFMLQNVGEC
jgi:hypothetical protein